MSTNYSFSISLIYTFDNDPAGLQVWGTGTLTLDMSNAPSVTGIMTVENPLGAPVPFTGTLVPAPDWGSPVILISGKTSQAWIEASLSFNADGFLYSGSYIGGVVDILAGNEWILYILQGLAPQAAAANPALEARRRRRLEAQPGSPGRDPAPSEGAGLQALGDSSVAADEGASGKAATDCRESADRSES